MGVVKVTKDNSFYLCHRCLEPFHQKSDIYRHLNRKKKCCSTYSCSLTDDDIEIKSLKRYYFEGETTIPTLTIKQKERLAVEYHHELNIIPSSFFKKGVSQRSVKSSSKPKPVLASDSGGGCSALEKSSTGNLLADLSAPKAPSVSYVYTDPHPTKAKDSDSDTDGNEDDKDDGLKSDHLSPFDSIDFDEILKQSSTKTIEDYVYINDDGEKVYRCLLCDSIFKKKRSLLNHLKTIKTCISRLSTQTTLINHKKLINVSKKANNPNQSVKEMIGSIMNALPCKESYEKTLESVSTNSGYKESLFNPEGCKQATSPDHSMILQQIEDMQKVVAAFSKAVIRQDAKQVTINNTQNINNNNINNTQNNSVKPKIQLELRDFFKDDYEYVHIKNKEVFNEAFFEHKNFLTHILSNDVNKNIYFKNGYAYLFAGGQIIRIPNDKAGYILMEKMFTTMGSFLRSNALINADDYDHIIRLFSVEKLKYLNDTIYKSYDVKTRQYLPDAVSLRRTRDKYLYDVTESTNKFKERTKEIFQQKATGSCPEQCPTHKIHIPGFIATRLRNQGFDDD